MDTLFSLFLMWFLCECKTQFKTAEDELSSLVDHSGESNEEDDLKQKND